MTGQAIVEFALILPFLMAILLGVAGIFYLDVAHGRMQHGIDTLTQLAATDPAWRGKVPEENDWSGCHADPLQPEMAYPDGEVPGGRVRGTWECHVVMGWVFDGLAISVSSEAVIGPSPAPGPVPSP